MITPGILKPQIKSKRILIVASNENFVKIKQQLEGSFEKKPQFFNLSHKQENLFNSAYLNDFARINKINEIIFSGENLSSESIMNLMIQLDNRDVDFKIAPPESLYIIGSSSVHTQGDVYTLKANSISTTENKRFKRTFDLVVSVLLISLFHITLLLKKGLVKSAFNVLWGHKTWVGFTESYHQALQKAPIKPAIFSIGILKLHKQFEQSFEWYTNNYTWQTDLKALYKAISQSNSAK